MDKIFGHKKDDEQQQVGFAPDQGEYGQQQSSTLTGEEETATGGQIKEKGLFGFGGGEKGSSSSSESESEEGKERQRRRREGRAARKQQTAAYSAPAGTDYSNDASNVIPPPSQGYGTTGYQESSTGEGAPEKKHHGFFG